MLIVVIIILIILSSRVFIDNNVIQICKYKIFSKRLPKEFNGFTIVQLADLHSKRYGDDNAKLINKINKINPNVIMVTGDMINDDGNYSVCIKLLENLSSKYKVYFIVGNHEQNLRILNPHKYNNMMAELMKIKVDVLLNEKREILLNGKIINLYGAFMESRYYRNMLDKKSKSIEFTLEDLEENIGQANSELYNILMIHNPIFFETYSDWGADLVLCGHMHGGMVRFPLIGGVFSPENNLFPKFCSGIFQQNNASMIVSRGIGIGSFGFRFFNRPELTVITLKNK
ncbi:metallophosphoesterase [Clostridium felsineum]|uniref:metallophosphoesterase n=1 Tax=Clostridium felsineum TaxID=36839 RepID=UPI00098C5DA0|nr:metallophosphoesterase [Clostridium felsineum]URZ15165.1 putative protein YpbG [Clostridium felsineum DSM 794]